MTRILLLLAAIALPHLVMSAEVYNSHEDTDSVTQSDISEQDDDRNPDESLSYQIGQTGDIRWELFSWGIGGGLILPLRGTDMISIGGEAKYDMLLGVRMRRGAHSLSAGLSFNCRWYSPKGDRGFMKGDGGRIILTQYPDNTKRHLSYLQVGSVQIPLLYGFSFGSNRDFGVLAGPVVNFNLWGRMSTSYTVGSNDYDTRTSFVSDRIGQTPVTVDVMAVARYRYMGLYARYTPMRMFKTSTGIDMSSLSLGIVLMFGAL